MRGIKTTLNGRQANVHKGKQTEQIRYLFRPNNFCDSQLECFHFVPRQQTMKINIRIRAPPSTTTSTSLHLPFYPPQCFVCLSVCLCFYMLDKVHTNSCFRGDAVQMKYGTSGTHNAGKYVSNGKYCKQNADTII